MDIMDPSCEQTQQMSSQSSMENMLGCSKEEQERKPKPQPEHALNCPRCNSTNTKFCYYNNYSLTQPRYFCKSCRRYWTKGGTLRNVPVGGGCRKNKRSSSSSSSKRVQDQNQTFAPNLNPFNNLAHSSYDHNSNDFALALARLQKQSCGQMGYDDNGLSILGNPQNHGFMDAIRSGLFLGNGLHYNNNVQNMYSGYGNGGDNGEVNSCNNNNNACGVSEEMMFPYDQEMNNCIATTNMKQEQSESKVFGGFPWQLNGGTNMVELESTRASWNNGFTSPWQGLLHSPLM